MKSHYLNMGIIFTNHRTKWAMVSVANRQITRENTYIKEITNHTNSTAQGGGGSFKNRKPIGDVGCCESRMAEQSH